MFVRRGLASTTNRRYIRPAAVARARVLLSASLVGYVGLYRRRRVYYSRRYDSKTTYGRSITVVGTVFG